MSIVSKLITPLHFTLNPPNCSPKYPFSSFKPLTVQCGKRTKRTGKQRYPSEKRKLKLKTSDPLSVETKLDGFWRLSKLQVSVSDDPGKDFLGLCDALLQEIAKVIKFPVISKYLANIVPKFYVFMPIYMCISV